MQELGEDLGSDDDDEEGDENCEESDDSEEEGEQEDEQDDDDCKGSDAKQYEEGNHCRTILNGVQSENKSPNEPDSTKNFREGDVCTLGEPKESGDESDDVIHIESLDVEEINGVSQIDGVSDATERDVDCPLSKDHVTVDGVQDIGGETRIEQAVYENKTIDESIAEDDINLT